MKSSPLRLALLALALTAGRASAHLHCISDLSQSNGGSFCKNGPNDQDQPQQPPVVNNQATGQLVNIAGGLAGGALGGLLSAPPLSNQYQGHKAVKPVVTDDDGIKTPGTGAAGDIIDSYKPSEDESYADRLAHFRELHDAEMDQRRAALEKLKGTSAEKWCAAHIGILFPEPPVSNVVNSYPNKVRAYDREKQIWDKRCGGPSAQDGYQGFTDELAGLKPDAPAAAPVAGTTTKAPTYEAPEPPPTAAPAAPEKPGDDFADAEKELEGPPAKKSATAPAPETPSSDQSPPSDVGAAPDSSPSPDDAKNTNRTTEFFGDKNAKVTNKDLADTRAPELGDARAGASSHSSSSGAGTQWAGIPPMKGMPEGPPKDFPPAWGTPEQVGAMFGHKRPPASPSTTDYLLRAGKYLGNAAADETSDETKKAFIANFGGLEGRILYNMNTLPNYILPKILSFAKGELTPGQADMLTVGAVNMLYNIDAAPNGVVSKIAEAGDAVKGAIGYGVDLAKGKLTDLTTDNLIYHVSEEAAQGRQVAHYGAAAAPGKGGVITNRVLEERNDAYENRQWARTALKGSGSVDVLFGPTSGDSQ